MVSMLVNSPHGLLSYQHGESPTDEQDQPDEVSPTDSLPQDEGGEEDGDEHAQLIDGDDHAGSAVIFK